MQKMARCFGGVGEWVETFDLNPRPEGPADRRLSADPSPLYR